MAILVDNFTGQPREGKGLRIELDYAGGPGDQPTFIGYAEPGRQTSEAVWKIMKLVYTGDNLVQRLWALDSSERATFSQVWDNRAGLTYG